MSRPTSPNTVASDVTLSPRETTVTFHCFTPSSVPSGQSPPPRPHGLMNAQPTAGGRRPLEPRGQTAIPKTPADRARPAQAAASAVCLGTQGWVFQGLLQEDSRRQQISC